MLEITAQLSQRCMCHTLFWLGKEITALYPMSNFILKIKSQCWTSNGWGPHSLMCSFLGTILHCPGHPGASCNLRDRFCRWRDRKPLSCPKPWAHFIPAALSSRGALPFHSVLSYIVLPKFKNWIYFATFCATVLQDSGVFGTELLPPALLGYFWILSDIWKENPVQNGSWRKALCPGEAHSKWAGSAWGWRQQGSRRSWAGVVPEQLPRGFASRDRFLRAFFILQKKTRRLAAWPEKISLVFCLF